MFATFTRYRAGKELWAEFECDACHADKDYEIGAVPPEGSEMPCPVCGEVLTVKVEPVIATIGETES